MKRARYQNKLYDFKQQGYLIVYMGKSGFEAETIKPYGYAPVGKPCIDRYNWQLRKRTNAIGDLHKKSLFTLKYVYKNMSWKMMYDWYKYTLIPSLKTLCVIVMDHARFHKHKRIQKILNRHGRRVL